MKLLIPLLLILTAQLTPAQSVSTLMGARAAGLGYASSTLSDEWSVWNNPAGLAQTKDSHLAFSLNKNALATANRLAALGATNFTFGTLGAGMFRFGDDIYSEQLLSAAYVNSFGLASLGMRIDYIQYRAEGYGTQKAIGITFGGIAAITPKFSVGAYATNLNQPEISDDEPLPTKLTIGTLYKPLDNLLLLAEVEKDLDFDPTIKGGVEYQFHKKLLGRTGFNLYPNAAFFGLGLISWRLKIDYAIQYSVALNFSHQASVSYTLKKQKRGDGE